MAQIYVELVCGPPGSGKSTYCEGKRQYYDAVQSQRVPVLVNLDPANDGVFQYPCDIDICDLIEHHVVMDTEALGPNGSYLFCIDFIAEHVSWLIEKIRAAAEAAYRHSPNRPVWFIVDCPGQVEFYIHSEALASIVKSLTKTLRASVCLTHLCDASVATRDVPTYVSTCLLCLSAMVDLELPHMNLLSKWDLVDRGPEGEEDEELAAFLHTSEFAQEHFGRKWQKDESRASRAMDRVVSEKLGRPASHRHSSTIASTGPQPSPVGSSSALSKPPTAGDDDDDDSAGAGAQSNAGSSANAVLGSSDLLPGGMRRLAETLMSVIEGYGLVGFLPLDVQNVDTMKAVSDRADASVGYMGK